MSKASPTKSQSASVQTIDIGDIHIASRLRSTLTDDVNNIAASIAELGQLQPIIVRKSDAAIGKKFMLVSGLHRIQGALQAGAKQIDAVIREPMDFDKAEMIEIAENLVRAELSPADRITYVDRWKKLHETAHPETKHGAKGGKKESAQNEHFDSATKTIAKASGRGESSVRRDATIAKKLGKLLAKVKGTWLDHDDEIKALSELPKKERDALIERAVAGEKVSAKGVQAVLAAKKTRQPFSPPVADAPAEPEDMDDEDAMPPAALGCGHLEVWLSIDRPLAEKFSLLLAEVEKLCHDEREWSEPLSVEKKKLRKDAVQRLRALRDDLVVLATPKKSSTVH